MIVENGPGAGRPERYGWGPSGRRLAEQGRWDELLERFRLARALGDPLSGPLGHLLAYGAPAALAARLFDPDGGPGAPATAADHDAGPLWEVLATRHPRAVLDALPLPPPIRRLAAHTRALLGEDPGADALDPTGVPYRLQPWEEGGWERDTRVREYLPGGGARRALHLAPPTREGLAVLELPNPGSRLTGLPATAALAALADWTTAVCVRGRAADAAAQLAGGPEVTGGRLPFAALYPALVHLASARPDRGTAQGRLAVWQLLTAMDGAATPSRPRAEALVARLHCLAWTEPADDLRHLHLALEDPATGLAWALSGTTPEPA
ncbi:hypothetical protein OU787_28600 [Kitasatospora sp. YST-16]|uniref:hypothetical protein n=1 Tax=Kitasatospora sp. YST-16 TaxID=2998080 RepID=UPI0022835DC0|nr:hypothetical protein [Kitasatospora sp. YST-16]WAL75135.1 hypothetical protein OU787_28600 [Kitasatospora sp. YST-16]WNW41194.1 hypothetical protein RKE32_28530 [Streptomyces sp. Li-HN-5-13]